DLLVEGVHQRDFDGTGLFALVGSEAPLLRDVRIEHVTAFVPRAVFSIGDLGAKMDNFTVVNNIFTAGEIQIGNLGGGPRNCAYQPEMQGPAGIWKSCFQNSSFSHNIIIGGSGWPKGNLTPKNMRAAGVREIRETGAAPYQLCRGQE